MVVGAQDHDWAASSPGKVHFDMHCIAVWLGPRYGMKMAQREKTLSLLQTGPSSTSPQALLQS
jgi:hypothetical protein